MGGRNWKLSPFLKYLLANKIIMLLPSKYVIMYASK